MTIVASGEISLGGNATTTRSVACELARSGTATICFNESAVRTLAARTTAGSAICMNNFYGKSNAPTTLGQVWTGGYYTGVVTLPTNYYLIVAPNASGCTSNQWKTTAYFTQGRTNNSSNGTCNLNDGYWNTFNYLNNGDHPAGQFAATRSIGGYSDWYLPAQVELGVLFNNKGSMPAGQQYASANYWSSSEFATTPYQQAYALRFFSSYKVYRTIKTEVLPARAVRRTV